MNEASRDPRTSPGIMEDGSKARQSTTDTRTGQGCTITGWELTGGATGNDGAGR
ncbi:unnamed protein product [Pararhodospirillum photometricum DSM 122]|uniref:Uncharacterized protein n=1 Tax=Pararhodospirillum photometricum DSM 122 TaxID=1150469 RepID=H6SNL0_PARPM|nr:unnamed protein product [Pararhodospirillum photometricum DSM 122]